MGSAGAVCFGRAQFGAGSVERSGAELLARISIGPRDLFRGDFFLQ